MASLGVACVPSHAQIPTLLAKWPGVPGGNVVAVSVSGSFALLADGTNGLHIIDISDPYHPARRGGLNNLGNAVHVSAALGYACVATPDNGLEIVDYHFPGSPTRVGQYKSNTGQAQNVVVTGNYAYVSFRYTSFEIIDLSVPANPVRVGIYQNDNPGDAAVAGNYAFVFNNQAGILEVLDVTSPAAPVRIGAEAPFSIGSQFALSSNYVFVVGSSRVDAVDVKNPSAPVRLSGISNSNGLVYDAATTGGRLYVANGLDDLLICEVSNPTNIVKTGSVKTVGSAQGLAVSANYLYVADGPGGLLIYDIRPPADVPKFLRVSQIAATNLLEISFNSIPGSNYLAQASTNFANWSQIARITSTNSVTVFRTPFDRTTSRQFIRVATE